MQGRPYSTPTAFTKWLELSLTAGDDSRSWEVVNCGGISYASYRLVPILKECLNHKPDLFIICTGHNEFLEDRSFSHIKHAPRYLSRPVQRLSRLRTVTLLRSAVSRITGRTATVPKNRPTLPAETNPLLDQLRNGLRDYHRDEKWQQGVVEHFEFNLRRIIHLATAADVPVVLVLPPSNLRRSPPFKSEHKAGLSDEELARWKSLVELARKSFRSNQRRAAELLEKAVRLDDRHAGTWYLLARIYDALWRTTHDDQFRLQARSAYIRARDEDICPLRMISPLENAMRRVAAETATPLIDAHALLERKTPDRILGDEFLVDYIHPSPVQGHRMIAQELALQLERRGLFRPSHDWGSKREAAFRRHLQSLNSRDPLYFTKGKQALEVLRNWAKGRLGEIPMDVRENR